VARPPTQFWEAERTWAAGQGSLESEGAAGCGLHFGAVLFCHRKVTVDLHPNELSHVGPQLAASLPGLPDCLCPLSNLLLPLPQLRPSYKCS
jgi:hypothetical protein